MFSRKKVEDATRFVERTAERSAHLRTQSSDKRDETRTNRDRDRERHNFETHFRANNRSVDTFESESIQEVVSNQKRKRKRFEFKVKKRDMTKIEC